jgi:hypothetical protein
MEIDLGALVEEVILKFRRNRTGPKPTVLALIPPDLPLISWQDEGLKKFINYFLYPALLMNHPEMPIDIIIHERTGLKDLEGFVGLCPLYWIQLRLQGHGSGMNEKVVEEIVDDLGYRREEWVGVEGSNAQLVIFGPTDKNSPKMVFCLDLTSPIRKCDLLIPVRPLPVHSPEPSEEILISSTPRKITVNRKITWPS